MSTGLGTFYGVGVGPGDPELLTLKALRLLQAAPIVFAPVARRGAHSLARTIVERYLDPSRQEIVELAFDMRDEAEGQTTRWESNARSIADVLTTGRDAVFITEGDPMLYSTFVHIARALALQLPDLRIVAVPGISSIHAAAAAAGIPLADGDGRLAILPATYEGERLRQVLETFDTVVLLKITPIFDSVLDLLEELGLVDTAVFVSRCGWPEESVVPDIRTLRGQKLDYFSTLIVRRTP